MGTKAPLSAGGKCLKLSFILLNLLYLLIGIALIAVGSYLVASGRSYSVFTGNHFFSGAAILIICGIVVFIITAVGIAGAFFQVKFVLYLYIVVVVIIIILEIVATILGFVYKDTISDTAQDNAADAVHNYRAPNQEGFDRNVNDAVDLVQETFKCCGWSRNGTSWLDTVYYDFVMKYPPSCECDNNTETNCMLVPDQVEQQFIYSDFCDDSLTDALQRSVIIVGSVGVVFAAAQLLPVLLAICLLYSMHKGGEYVTV